MATLGIDGIVSGLDTTALISQLMQVEAAPQTLLRSKQSAAQGLVTALQALNTKVASLADAATNAAKPASWTAFAATTTGTGATAVVSSSQNAGAGSVTFSVDSVAKPRVAVTAAVPDDGTVVGLPPKVTVKGADGSLVTVEPTSGSLADVAKALNAATAAGVAATVVRVTNGETPTYRIQFTGTTSGDAGAFEVYAGDADAVTAGTATRLDTSTVQDATNASITLWKGSPAEVTYTQSSNTFANLMSGVDVTVSAVTEADKPVTVTVAQDTAAIKKLASGLVGAMGVVFSEISSRTAIATTTSSDGTTKVTGGLFTGDSAIRGIQSQLVEAASYPIDGISPSTVGIVLGKDGAFTFDEAAFTKALAEDPTKVQAVVAGLAERIASVATGVSDKYEGSLTLKIQGQEKLVSTMGTQIEDWDRRLTVRRESLQRTYSALEVTLSKLQSQSSWLANQLSSLSATKA